MLISAPSVLPSRACWMASSQRVAYAACTASAVADGFCGATVIEAEAGALANAASSRAVRGRTRGMENLHPWEPH